jgi:pimeloyl-ACP methyl ester carboxylesterase
MASWADFWGNSMRLLAALASLVVLAAPAAPWADPIPASVIADPPQDKAHPAQMVAFALPTHGVNINAVLYTAAGAGPHPTVLLLHGLPGNEQNLDLAQAIRREGWNVMTMHYRGAWGSPGSFTFAHCLEDAASALTWLRTPEHDAKYRIDPRKLVMIGHSMGGWITAYIAAHDPEVLATGLISAGDIGSIGAAPRATAVKIIDDNIGTSDGMHTLAATPESLADEAIRNTKAYAMAGDAPGLAKHPLLLVTSDDGLKSGSDALAKAIGDGAAPITQVHLATDHSYSDQRIALEAAVIRWLENLPGAPAGL